MASITVTALDNGIAPANMATLAGVIPLNSGGGVAYLYYDTGGVVYYQSAAGVAATILLSAGFAINCVEKFFDGSVFTVFFGGNTGNCVHGTIDPSGVSTLAPSTKGSDDFTSVCFDFVQWQFIIGTRTGKLLFLDSTGTTLTLNQTLSITGVPVGATLNVASLSYDITSNTCLAVCNASTNVNTDAPNNFSALFYITPNAPIVASPIVGKNLWLGAIGMVENATGLKVIKLVAAGEEGKIFQSDDGITWIAAVSVDQAITINSLSFNAWVFVAGLLYGIVLLSTNGSVWESSYDALLGADIIAVSAT